MRATTTNINKRVERAFYKSCSGIPINIMDIEKVFVKGRALIIAGASEEDLAREIREFTLGLADGDALKAG
jgi:hypothetical protein